MTRSIRCALAAMLLLIPGAATAQDTAWSAEVTAGWAGFIDDHARNYLVLGGGIRRHVTPRVSIGPEVVLMSNGSLGTDRIVMLTGNAVFDVLQPARDRRVVLFVVAGGGIVWMRDQVGTGPFWSSDPSFTVGGGVRARVSESIAAGAEYRLGWEPHHRLTAFVSYAW